jgi:hypothetical protein
MRGVAAAAHDDDDGIFMAWRVGGGMCSLERVWGGVYDISSRFLWYLLNRVVLKNEIRSVFFTQIFAVNQ